MPIILGRPLLAMDYAQVDIFKKLISIKVGNEKVIFKMRSSFTSTTVEFIRTIRSKTRMEDDDLVKVYYDLFLYDSESCEIEPDIFSYDIDIPKPYVEIVYKMTEAGKETHLTHKGETDYWREKLNEDQDDMSVDDGKDLKECRKDKANAILGVVLDKLKGDWYDGTSEDENDLEGIIDYLEPKSYDRFIDLDDEVYKERKCKLLGMTYRKPPTILIEKVEVTRYTIDPGETYTKNKSFRN
nr:hypothetical protein [Tanacetum cinerariifolium]